MIVENFAAKHDSEFDPIWAVIGRGKTFLDDAKSTRNVGQSTILIPRIPAFDAKRID